MRQKKFSVIKHIEDIQRKERHQNPNIRRKKQIVHEEKDILPHNSQPSNFNQLLVVPKNNPFEPFTEEHVELVAALKNFFVDSCNAFAPVLEKNIQHISSYLIPVEQERRWLQASPNTRFFAKKNEELARLRLPDDQVLKDITTNCEIWQEIQYAAFSAIIYKTTPPRALQAPPVVAMKWSPEPASTTGFGAISVLHSKFLHMSALLLKCQSEMRAVQGVVSQFFLTPQSTFRINITGE